ncbi:piggyBac transposable element-derived protein 4-like [Penaeus monodon]|uniref:piggyBac transposable element-derived protein 4-like n=1 Tax=Penaeus monodon TaxID=6687 RepID=UPI0018A71F9E|nr:piggyBac transposable element-derived protein 4-like [Penaeus monodon]
MTQVLGRRSPLGALPIYRRPMPSSRAPQPIDVGNPRLRNAPDPLLYRILQTKDYTPPLKLPFEISARFDGDDSDWERSEFDTDDSGVDDDWEEDFDYVPLVDTSLDSDVRRHWERNAPGTPSFCWSKRENFVWRHCFEGTPGVKAPLEESSSPYVRQNPRTPSSHMKGWEAQRLQEVCSYVGLRFPMGLQSKRDQREWWSTDPLMSSSVFAKTMTRDRYDALTSALHFAAEDRLWKLRPVLDVLESTYRSVFVPNKNVTVDESLWAFKGCHHAIQYNPSKRARRGLKVYKLCSSDGPEAGYTAAFKIYMGQEGHHRPAGEGRSTRQGVPVTHRQLARKTSAVGTVRLNRRGMPSDLQASRGQIDFRSSKTGIICRQWVDKRPVTMLSTAHTSKVVTLPPNRRGVERSKPEVVVDYNNGMKGVDLSDQLAQSYPSTKKTVKWYKKISSTYWI